MANQSTYPVTLDGLPGDVVQDTTPMSSGQWNQYFDGVVNLETAVGLTGSSAALSSLNCLAASSVSHEPGHKHNELWQSSGAAQCISGGATQQTIAIGGIKYIWPSTLPTCGALLANDGAGNLSWGAGRIKVHIYRNAAQNVAATTTALMSADTILYDTSGTGAADVTLSRITPGVIGYYFCFGGVGLTSVADAKSVQVLLYKNGALAYSGTRHGMGGTGNSAMTVSGLLYLDADDYVSLYVYNGDASTRALTVATFDASYLELIGPF